MTKEQLKVIMGDNIRTERTARNLSIDELAALLELTPGFVGLIERGQRGVTAYTLYKLSIVLDMPINGFFEDHSNSSVKLYEDNPILVNRSKLLAVASGLDAKETAFLIDTVKSIKVMHGQ